MEEVDLSKIPVPTLALKDGGPYFSNCVIIAKDPDTGVRNTSVHRLMVTGKNRLGLLMYVGRHLRDYYERAEAKGQSLEITINNGAHPAYYVAAITPSAAAPIDVDELGVASYLLGEPAKLCKSKTVDVEGIAEAQMIMEAEILPALGLVAELHTTDALASFDHLVEIQAPYLRAWRAMADEIDREEIVIPFTEKLVQSCDLTRGT